ncbi:MAG TPA: hypothetical protein VGG34_03865 [Opitutaceae bacterium]|jgi:hypothetical protein
MSLFAASFIPGIVLLAVGAPLLMDVDGVKAAIKAFPRSTSVGYVVFSAATVWFLYNILHLSSADFGEYRLYLFAGFGAIAVLAFKCVPDFLGVRGASALVLLAAWPFLDAAYMEYGKPTRLFMVSFVYLCIAIAIWLGAQPWRLRDFLSWVFARQARSRGLGALFVAYGAVLVAAAFTLR